MWYIEEVLKKKREIEREKEERTGFNSQFWMNYNFFSLRSLLTWKIANHTQIVDSSLSLKNIIFYVNAKSVSL